MSRAILPLPNTPSCRGAQLKRKHRDNFTFYLHRIETLIPHYSETHVEVSLLAEMYTFTAKAT